MVEACMSVSAPGDPWRRQQALKRFTDTVVFIYNLP
jgi:hypothetical protein